MKLSESKLSLIICFAMLLVATVAWAQSPKKLGLFGMRVSFGIMWVPEAYSCLREVG